MYGSGAYGTGKPVIGGTPGSVLFVDSAGNLGQDNTHLFWDETNKSLIVGDPGTEANGITVNGVTYDSTLKVSDIDGTHLAQTILHRHSTVLEPLIVGARSNSNTSAHADVTAGQNLFTIFGLGTAGNDYKIFGQISVAADSGTISNTSAPGRLVFATTQDTTLSLVEAARIDNQQRLIVGGSQALDFSPSSSGQFSQINSYNNGNITGNFGCGVFSNNSGGGVFLAAKSRATTIGTNTIVQANDNILNIIFRAADGVNYPNAARIQGIVDGTPGVGDMPGALTFATTPDGSVILQEALRIDNTQTSIFSKDRALRFNNQTSAAGAAVGTLNNAPVAGDPNFWVKINIGGTNCTFPAWLG